MVSRRRLKGAAVHEVTRGIHADYFVRNLVGNLRRIAGPVLHHRQAARRECRARDGPGGGRLIAACERLGAAATSATVLAAALLLGGCATIVPGLPVSVGGSPRAVDLGLLDVGSYSTQPRSPLGTAGTPAAGNVVEAQRLANYVVGPWEVAPEINSRYAMGALALTDANALSVLGPNELGAVSGRHNFVNGFATARQAEGQASLINAVLRFADPPSAAAALRELAGIAASDRSGAASEERAVIIPGQPDAVATSSSITDVATQRQWSVVRSFTTRGPYILTELATSVRGLTSAVRLVSNTIDLQRRVIDQFPAIELGDFADIALDSTGLLARTLPLSPQQASASQNGRFGKRGVLHFQRDPIEFSALFDSTVMDLAARAKTNVYRSSDADAAARIVERFAARAETAGGRPVDGVAAMPASRCLQHRVGYYCTVPAGRFAIEAHSLDLQDARQQIAAQYTLLVK